MSSESENNSDVLDDSRMSDDEIDLQNNRIQPQQTDGKIGHGDV